MDLRERVLAAYARGDGTQEELAELFDVSVRWIQDLLRRRRETDSIAPRPHGGRQVVFDEAGLQRLRQEVAAQPDATLEELRQRTEAGSTSPIWRALPQWQRFGSLLGIAILLGYTGRRYYWQVLQRALTFRSSVDAESWAAWACRAFLAACAGLVWMLMSLGLEALLAILAVMLLLLLFLVMARMTAEDGLFWIQPYWGPVAVPLALWINYNYGRPPRDAGGSNPMCEQPYNLAVKSINTLRGGDQLEASIAIDEGPGGGWRRLIEADPDPRFLAAAGVGLALVIGFSWARLRFPWWPIHPIIFLVWGSYPMAMFATSFLLGWVVKAAITRITGGQGYQKAKPLMVGVIAGDLLGGLIFMVIGAIYYASTGLAPKDYQVFPI